MTAKSLLIVGALGLASVGIASARSYDITLPDAAMVGNKMLKPGDYKLKVDGSQAVFTDVQNSKSWTAPAKVLNGSRKFDETAVESSKLGDMDHINAIDLAGSHTRLEFDR